MEAGPKLDALVAEKVLGLEVDCRCCGSEHWESFPPGYSTGIAAAWKVMESRWMVGQTIGYLAETPSEQFTDITEDGWAQRWCCTSRGEPIYAATAPLAICLAALKAAGVDIDNL